MTRKQRRMTMIGAAGVVLFAAVGLILFALQDQIVFFNSPSDVAANSVKPGQRIRLGGLVKDGTINRGQGTQVSFVVTDGGADVTVAYNGILPDLFREGQGVVTEGVMNTNGTFDADTVLAKHDETYMPKEVADALKEQGHWQGDEAEAKTY
ncbi:cytochrome c maturation protein CcmE [Cohaesibacter gelatinilyticus]|uniref:Cytochrome c-type biogenesis protein CcmE n=1 Tax=Cohaesibacter gelatinilyticus TaxID=372072 RepID=A0A285NHJ4_9HYPH|nr:cytochrome c maturation protein CcmE [Cohaesibacter gelatinilyticus]SNZ07131.1 cytochrome c-type biogenesis protein CcmE [Cohaesibacter gelatinilyticus]